MDPRSQLEFGKEAEEGRSPFVPLLVVVVALAIWTGFQTLQFLSESSSLDAARSAQQGLVEQGQRARAQLESLAQGTLQLAQQGNPHAGLIVENLRKRGITIKPGAPPPK